MLINYLNVIYLFKKNINFILILEFIWNKYIMSCNRMFYKNLLNIFIDCLICIVFLLGICIIFFNLRGDIFL